MNKHLINFLFFLIFLLSIIPAIPTAPAAWPTLVWAGFREIALDTAIDALQDLFKETVTPEEVAMLNQRVSTLDAQLVEFQQQGDYPSLEEFNTIKQLVTGVSRMVSVMAERLDSVEQRVSQLEQEIAQLRQALLTVSSENPELTSTSVESLDFQIHYLYRVGGKGNYKPLTNETVLQAGDHYKIIFTPVVDSHVYIFQVDSANKLFRLFPLQGFEGATVNYVNPVKGGNTYYVPAPHQSFELDQQVGMETIYFVATRQPDIVIENLYQALSVAEQQNQIAKTQQLQVQLLNTVREGKGPKRRLVNDTEGTAINWQEKGENFSVLQKYLDEMCNGCVDTLTFKHRF